MTSENTALVIELTQSILEHFWLHDHEKLLKYMDDDFSLTDSLHQYLVQGKEEVCGFLATVIGESTKCRLSNKKFLIAQNCGSACTVIGQYTLSPVDDIDGQLKLRQHCVFVWELTKSGGVILKHIGVSKPDSSLPSDYSASFCTVPGTAKAEAGRSANSDRMIITDTSDCTRFVSRSAILYVTSDGRNSQIHCFSGNISARLSISAFMENAGDNFLLIHRCYAINLDHITLLKPYCIIMSDGSELPVPVKRYSEIKQKLTELINRK